MMRLATRALTVATLSLLPLSALAHETQVFEINGKSYSIVMGSIGEPVVVDDKSGVETMISLVETEADEHADEAVPHEHDEGTPVVGLDATLKVEVSAGDQSITLPLKPVWNEEGSYQALFFPTVQTTYTYRLMGTIDGVTVDLPFTCNPAGHPRSPDDTTPVKMSDSVTRTLKKGAFGCPLAKTDLGFPEKVPTLRELRDSAATTPALSPTEMAALALGALGTLLGLSGLMRGRQ